MAKLCRKLKWLVFFWDTVYNCLCYYYNYNNMCMYFSVHDTSDLEEMSFSLGDWSLGDWVWDCQWLTDDMTACHIDDNTHTVVPGHRKQIITDYNTGHSKQLITAQNTGDRNQLITAQNTGDRNQLIAEDTIGDRNHDNTGDECHLRANKTAASCYHIAAALGHNSVVLCCWRSRSILQHVYCAESCILYLF